MTELREAISRLKLSNAYTSGHMLSRCTEFIPTGCFALDLAIGGGKKRLGIPVGRMTEIFGEMSTGKSLLGVHILANTQKMGGIAVYIDTECAMSDDVMNSIGVNVDELISSTPDTVEEVFAVIEEVLAMRKEEFPDKLLTIVWDSVAATTSKEELDKVKKEGLNSRASMAAMARALSQFGRCMPREIATEKVALVCVNQVREKVGVMFGESFTTTGGKAIGFYSSLRIQLSKKTIMKDLDNAGHADGIIMKAHIYKNKLAQPYEIVEIPVLFAKGMDDTTAMLWKLKEDKFIVTKGAWNTIAIQGQDYRFQTPGWPEFYEANAEVIQQEFYGE